MLKPGGMLVIAGEPTRIGHAVNKLARRATATSFKALGRVRPGLVNPDRSVTQHDDPAAALERHVDLHEFHPHMVEAWLRDAGFGPLRIRTEEFVSGFFGWSVRTVEALAAPGLLTERWAYWAYRNYLRLYRLDDAVTRHRGSEAAVLQPALLRGEAFGGAVVSHPMEDPRPFIAEAAAGRRRGRSRGRRRHPRRRDPSSRPFRLRRLVARSFPVRVGRTLRFIWSHRLYTWRYWILGIRFLKFKITHPHVKTEGFVFLGPKVEVYAASRLRPADARPLGLDRERQRDPMPRGESADR